MIPTGVDIVDESGIVPAQESSRPLHDDFILPRPFSSTNILSRLYFLRQRLLWALSVFHERTP